MQRFHFLTFAVLTVAASIGVLSSPCSAGEAQSKTVRVVIQTDQGDIEVELDPVKAPMTVANFLRYVDAMHYDGGRFHRTVTLDNQPNNKVKIEVVQAGVHPDKSKRDFASIKLERTRDTGLKHTDGAISMARDGPDTATSDFFLCIGDQPELDFGGKRNPDGQGFAVFGRVVKGMDVVKDPGGAAKGQTLTPPVTIRDRRATSRQKTSSMPFSPASFARIATATPRPGFIRAAASFPGPGAMSRS